MKKNFNESEIFDEINDIEFDDEFSNEEVGELGDNVEGTTNLDVDLNDTEDDFNDNAYNFDDEISELDESQHRLLEYQGIDEDDYLEEITNDNDVYDDLDDSFDDDDSYNF